jgi:hypothetical protein
MEKDVLVTKAHATGAVAIVVVGMVGNKVVRANTATTDTVVRASMAVEAIVSVATVGAADTAAIVSVATEDAAAIVSVVTVAMVDALAIASMAMAGRVSRRRIVRTRETTGKAGASITHSK